MDSHQIEEITGSFSYSKNTITLNNIKYTITGTIYAKDGSGEIRGYSAMTIKDNKLAKRWDFEIDKSSHQLILNDGFMRICYYYVEELCP